jgi:Pyruvate/2-oxoacid:ferredoxin oxidoreductase delta subunit
MMVSININPSKYSGCNVCAIFGPKYALSVPGDNFKCQVDQDLRNSCPVCLDYRTSDAIEEV